VAHCPVFAVLGNHQKKNSVGQEIHIMRNKENYWKVYKNKVLKLKTHS
jgi:hypothetical protein